MTVMAFTIEQNTFNGPLELLLELLDKKELEIKDIGLAGIADDYLNYLDSHEIPSNALADFLLIASRLIYIKSRELMPYLAIDDEEEAVATLEDQLRAYRMFAKAADKIGDLFSSNGYMFSARSSRIKKEAIPNFVAPSNIDENIMRDAFMWVVKRLKPFFALNETSIERVKSVNEKMDELRNVITSRAELSFKDVLRGAKSRAEVVVSFLALLELIRRQVVKASQKGDNDIVVQKV